MQQSNLC